MSSKNATATAKTSNPSKSASKAKGLERVNLEKAAAKAEVVRESKYNYPADVTTAKAKKVFRRNARAARSKFESTIADLRKSNDKKAKAELANMEKEFKAFQGVTYSGK